jgi:hypothetical protein
VTATRVVAGWTVCARRGRVWLHPTGDGDGDLTPVAIATDDATARKAF